jgi:hypothetical protein
MPPVLQIVDLSDSQATRSYLRTQTLRSWLLTTDHKRVGLLYLYTTTDLATFGRWISLVCHSSAPGPQRLRQPIMGVVDLVAAFYGRIANTFCMFNFAEACNRQLAGIRSFY